MAKHRRTAENGRHRKPSANVRPGLMAAAAGGVLYAALSVSGASAAELNDEQSISAEESGGYAEGSYGTGASSGTEPGTYADESGVGGEVLSEESQPEAEAGSGSAEESYQADAGRYAEGSYGTGVNSGTEPGTHADESGVGGEVLSEESQPEAEAGSGSAEESYQADAGRYAEGSYGTGVNSGSEPGTHADESGADGEVPSGEAHPGGEEQPRSGSVEESYQADVGGYAEGSYGAGASSGSEPGTYAHESGAGGAVLSDESQPAGEEQPRAGLEVDEASQFSPSAQAEPGMESAEPGVSLVNDVDRVPVFQVLEDDGTQPEAEAGSGQPPTDEQAQPADRSEQATVRSGDRIQPEGIPLGSSGCTAGPLVSHESGASGILTAGHCEVRRWTDRDGRYLGPTLVPEVEVEGTDVEIVKLDGDVVPEPEFTGTAEPYLGQDVCARGATSAEEGRGLERCGQVTDLDVTEHYDKQVQDANGEPIRNGIDGLPVFEIGPTVTDLIKTDIPTLAGDSGGPLYEKDTLGAVGTLSGGNGDSKDTCGSPNAKASPGSKCYPAYSHFVPIAKGLSSYPGWRVSTAPRLRPSGSVVEPF